MDLEILSPPHSPPGSRLCNCGCSCCGAPEKGLWIRSVKRKFVEFEDGNRFCFSDIDGSSYPRVQIEIECEALRETVSTQQKVLQELSSDLEEERNASSTAANEAMSMILRLQREKAEIQMEARQFKQIAEQKMAHDQDEIFAFEDLLYRREQIIQSLTCEVQAYKHRLMSFGLTEEEADAETGFNYPPLKCKLHENQNVSSVDDDNVDVEKYAFGETPRDRDHLKNIEHRIYQMERSPSTKQLDTMFSIGKNTPEKVIVGQSPRKSRHRRRSSMDSSSSFHGLPQEMAPEASMESPTPKSNSKFMKADSIASRGKHLKAQKGDNGSEFEDDTSDRVYTIDSIHNTVHNNTYSDHKESSTPSEDCFSKNTVSRINSSSGPDIVKLSTRLEALEADRESMRQALISMRTDKAQLILLKEIAQHLCKDMPSERCVVHKRASFLGVFSIISLLKWLLSIFWRRRHPKIKYMFGLSPRNAGLLLLLDRGPHPRHWRCLRSTQV